MREYVGNRIRVLLSDEKWIVLYSIVETVQVEKMYAISLVVVDFSNS